MFATLREAGADLAGTRAFADHHPYTRAELDALSAEAARLGADLVTTHKDHVRLPPAFSGRVAILPVTLEFRESGPLLAQLAKSLGRP
jgi:tetraacyldisaccharide 4'-kinase